MGFDIKKYFIRYSAFFRGMGSLSLFPYNNYKQSWMRNDLTPQEQDALAIKGDWEKVGQDMKTAMDYIKKPLLAKKDLSKNL